MLNVQNVYVFRVAVMSEHGWYISQPEKKMDLLVNGIVNDSKKIMMTFSYVFPASVSDAILKKQFHKNVFKRWE